MRCLIGYYLISTAVTLLIGGFCMTTDGFSLKETIVFLAYIELFLVLLFAGGYLIAG